MVVFTPTEEVQGILVVPRDMAEEVVMDFLMEGWVENQFRTLSVALEEGVVLWGHQV